MRRIIKKSPRNLLLILLIIVIIIWNEYLALKIKCLFWITPSSKHYSILIVSDPHLIGYRNERFGAIARWDSDRYLKYGFEAAVASAQPQMILFLGDLFDKGVDMNSQEFEWTLNRFENIFSHVKNIPTIYLPGDNDIGGENEPIYDRLVSRFNRSFVHSLKYLDDFASTHIDIAATIPSEDGKFKSIIQANNPGIKILLSHVPLLRSFYRAHYEVVEKYSPNLILTAHDHAAELYLRNQSAANFLRYVFNKRLDFLISSQHPIIEIQNPTVSYRMGVPTAGYGVLTFYDESPFAAVYTVFWLPGRYLQLYLYIFAIVVVCFILLPWIIFSSHGLMKLANSRRKKNFLSQTV